MSVTSNIGLWLYQIGQKFRITQNSDSLNKNFEKIDSVVGAVPSGKSLQGQIGDTPLTTTAQTLTGAIAEHEQDLISQNQAIGNLSNLTTTEKGSLVGAANELNSKLMSYEIGEMITVNVPLSTAGINSYDMSSSMPTKAGYSFIGFVSGRSETWRVAYIGFAQYHLFYAVVSNGTTSGNGALYLYPLFKKN